MKLFKIILIQNSKFLYEMRRVKLINVKMQNIFLKYWEFMHSSANLFEKYLYLHYFVYYIKVLSQFTTFNKYLKYQYFFLIKIRTN